ISSYLRHVVRLPLGFFESRRVGEILARVNDAAKIREAISGVTLGVVVDGMTVLLSAAVLLWYDWPLGLTSLAFVPLVALAIAAQRPAIRRKSRAAMEQQAELEAHMVEEIGGVETLKSFRMERGRGAVGEEIIANLSHRLGALQHLGLSVRALALFLT